MPTATSTLGWTLTNLGTLPETYTLDPTCTAVPDIFIAWTDFPQAPRWAEVCATATTDNCWPVPTGQSAVEEYVNNPYLIGYVSPAVACPSGYKSVGGAANPVDGPVTSSGIFGGVPGRWDYDGAGGDETAEDMNDDVPVMIGWKDAVGALLDDGETVIACCPSSMTATMNGLCYETLPSHPVSTACDGTWTSIAARATTVSTTYMLDGTTRTGTVIIPATDSVYPLPIASTTTTFSPEETETLVAVRVEGVLVLLHHESDFDVSPTDSEEGAHSESESESEEPEEEVSDTTETNLAIARFYTGASGWGQICGMLGVLGVSALLGVGLVLHA
ncbi:hypothetical protein BJX65DRAFT_283207 [Aspergillus insuetus]